MGNARVVGDLRRRYPAESQSRTAQEGRSWGSHFDGFDKVAAAGAIEARPLRAMWIIDPLTEQSEVVPFRGPVAPGDLAPRITERTAMFPMGRAGLKEKPRR